jgi:hypothetical protein
LTLQPDFAPTEGASELLCENDHDPARRENRETKLAMSRTEPTMVRPISVTVAHGSVNAALASLPEVS